MQLHSNESSTPEVSNNLKLICLSTLGFLVVSVYAFGKQTKVISDLHSLYPTPPGKWFKIWILIFLGLTFAGVSAFLSDGWSQLIWILYGVINLFAGLIIITFNTNKKPGVFCSSLLLLANAFNLQFLNWQLNSEDRNGSFEHLIRNIFSFYLGWAIAGAAIGLGVILVYFLGMKARTHLWFFWLTSIPIYAFVLYLNITVLSSLQDCIGLIVSSAYAITGAFISSAERYSREEKQKKL